MQKSVKKTGFHSINATIHTPWESWCLPYAIFFSSRGRKEWKGTTLAIILLMHLAFKPLFTKQPLLSIISVTIMKNFAGSRHTQRKLEHVIKFVCQNAYSPKKTIYFFIFFFGKTKFWLINLDPSKISFSHCLTTFFYALGSWTPLLYVGGIWILGFNNLCFEFSLENEKLFKGQKKTF